MNNVKPLDLPRLEVPIVQEIAKPEALGFVERPSGELHKYGQAHAFIGRVDNAQVIGSGSLVTDEGIMVHGLSTGNYFGNISQQLSKYEEVPQGNLIPGEHVLIWGVPNFGHWVITYLLRTTLLWFRTELMGFPLLLSNDTPQRFVDWLKRMGFSNFTTAQDGDRVEKLWIPSVVCYRGHYEDMKPYIFPESVHLLRRLVLRELIFPHSVRERLYLSRDRSKWRRVANETEFVSQLSRHGIRRLFMDELSLETQLDLVSRAELLIVAAGGDSPITMFAPSDCEIVELAPPNYVGTFGSRCWAHVLGQKFRRINGEPVKKTGPLPIDWDFIVPLGQV